jgi:hypothetical protein
MAGSYEYGNEPASTLKVEEFLAIELIIIFSRSTPLRGVILNSLLLYKGGHVARVGRRRMHRGSCWESQTVGDHSE